MSSLEKSRHFNPRGGTASCLAIALLMVATAAWSAPGDLLWENRGQTDPESNLRAIDAEGHIVVGTGESGQCTYPTFNTCHWFVRALDTRTGEMLWQDRLDTSGSFGSAAAVAIDCGQVFAAGWIRIAGQPEDLFIRAYSLKKGKLLWEKRVHRAAWTERAFSLKVHDGRVFVAGNVASASRREEFALLVFDARTGSPLWESEVAGVPNPFNYAFARAGAVTTQDERVFVAGSMTSTAPSGISLLVRAHDARTGLLLWQDEVPDAELNLNPTTWGALATFGNLLFVAGGVSTPNPQFGQDFMVRAYDSRTGILKWVDVVHRQAGGAASRLAVGDGGLFAYGWDCSEEFFNCHGNVRAYNPRTGKLRWEARFSGEGGDALIPTDALEVHGHQVIVGASLLTAQQDRYEWTVRSFNAGDGTLRWESSSTDAGFLSTPEALKFSGGRLFAGGSTAKSDDTDEFTIRAYRARYDDDKDADEAD